MFKLWPLPALFWGRFGFHESVKADEKKRRQSSARREPGDPASKPDRLNLQRAAKPPGSVVRFRPVVVDEDMIVAPIAEERAAQSADFGRGL